MRRTLVPDDVFLRVLRARNRVRDAYDERLTVASLARTAGLLQRIATAKDEFAEWFRGQGVTCHGIDLNVPPPPPPELVIDLDVQR